MQNDIKWNWEAAYNKQKWQGLRNAGNRDQKENWIPVNTWDRCWWLWRPQQCDLQGENLNKEENHLLTYDFVTHRKKKQILREIPTLKEEISEDLYQLLMAAHRRLSNLINDEL